MESYSADEQRFMARALDIAALGVNSADPNPRVGCVLVKEGLVVGEGWHRRTGEAHAEVHAITNAGDAARNSTAFVTLEPCCHHGRTPPCTDALIDAGVSGVIAAMVDPDPRVAGKGLERLRRAGIEVRCGLFEKRAQELNIGYISRLTRGRPWVRLKMAMSLDGRTAMASGESQWITGAPAREDVQHWRARSSAILTGVQTVVTDDPALNVRLETTPMPRQPMRVVLDPDLRIPTQAKTLRLPGKVLICTRSTARDARGHLFESLFEPSGVEIVPIAARGTGIDLVAVLEELARRGCNEVHLECGARLAGAMMSERLVDEFVVYIAPMLLGSDARGLVDLPSVSRLADGLELEWIDHCLVGQDWRIVSRPRICLPA